jgi:hypothetical protein
MRHPVVVPEDANGLEALQRRSFYRAATARALHAFAKARDAESTPERVVHRAWPRDADAITIIRAAVPPLTTSSTLGQISRVALWQLLAPASAAARLFAHPSVLNLDFEGVATYSIPHVASPPAPIWVAEGAAIPAISMTHGSTTIGPPRKLAFLAGITNELEAASPEAASAIIGRTMTEAATRALDAAVFSSVAGDSSRPPGLFFGVTPIAATAAGGQPLHAMASDLGNLSQAVANAQLSTADLVVVAGTATATKLALLAGPAFQLSVFDCATMATDSIAMIAPSGIATGYAGLPATDTTRQGEIVYDTAPGDPLSGRTISTFQNDLLVLRVRVQCAWAALPGAVQLVNGVSW